MCTLPEENSGLQLKRLGSSETVLTLLENVSLEWTLCIATLQMFFFALLLYAQKDTENVKKHNSTPSK